MPNEEELKRILADHNAWLLSDGKNGQRANLQDAGLSSANLKGAGLCDANLKGAGLILANLQGAVLSGAQLQGAHLAHADLRGAHLHAANIEGADLDSANLQGAQLQVANLEGANLASANLKGADLREANLKGADLSGAALQGANLLDASFRDARLKDAGFLAGAGDPFDDAANLSTEQFAGADVSGVSLPPDIAAFDGLGHVADVSRHARNIFVATIGACAYAWLTIGTTTDARLLTNSASSPLPVIQTEVPIAWFYLASPVILLAVYTYLHFYLHRMWEGLATLPAIFPDGKPLHQKAYPWLLAGLVRANLPLLRNEQSRVSRLENLVSVFLAWWAVPLTLCGFWLRYLPRHDWPGTVFLSAAVLLAVAIGIYFYRLAGEELRGPFIEQPRFRPAWSAFAVLLILAPLAGTAIETKSGLRGLGFTSHADLRETDVSTKPDDWWKATPAQREGLEGIKGAALRGSDLRYADAFRAFLAKADLRYANLKWADLIDANLQGANLAFADLQGADLLRANLQRANLREANLQGANLLRANLKLANLEGANLQGANLEAANLEGAVFRTVGKIPINLASADLSFAKGLTQEQLDQACGDDKTELPEVPKQPFLDSLTIKPCRDLKATAD